MNWPASALRPLVIEYLQLSQLTPDPRNARKHTKKQIRHLAAIMRRFGFTNPILIDERGFIIAGHARYEAAALAELTTVPCIRISGLNEASRTALAIADNKLGDMSEFDLSALTKLLAELDDLSFDMELTGFDTAELDVLLSTESKDKLDPADFAEEVDLLVKAVTRMGDLWLMGEGHRLVCGNALTTESYDLLLPDAKADLVFTDPPFNVKIQGHVSGLGKHQHPEFAMASGEMSSAEFTGFLTSSLSLAAANSRDGSIHYVCMDFRHMRELLDAGHEAYTELKNLCVWDKQTGGMGSLYRSQHELVFVFKKGTAAHVNNVMLGAKGRYRTNVWSYPGLNQFGQGRDEGLARHPTSKNLSLVADAIRDCSNRGDLVLDPFMGSGTVIMAAERTRRRAAGIELDPHYVDGAIRRWQKSTGKVATLAADGRTFAQVEAARAADTPSDGEAAHG